MASAEHIADRFQLGRTVSYARLSGLETLGLVEHARIFHTAPGVYLATRTGLVAVDLHLPPARVDLRTYDHDLELASGIIDLEREFGADRITTEREMRAVGTSLALAGGSHPRLAVPLSGARGQLQLTPVGNLRLHFPDCAVSEKSGRVLAIELERTPKGRARLHRIIAGYVGARHIAGVRYYAAGDRVRRLVESEVSAQTADALVTILPWRLDRGVSRSQWSLDANVPEAG